MTVEEVTRKLKAGEAVTLYEPRRGANHATYFVFKRTLKLDKKKSDSFFIEYENKERTAPILLTGKILQLICERSETNYWLAYGRMLRGQTYTDQSN